MKRLCCTLGIALLGGLNFLPSVAHAGTADWVRQYDVAWSSPSRNAAGSMPLGNGVVGVNLWVEENGDLLFYISRNDSLSEVSQLCKLGRVRVTLTPNPFAAGAPFRQQLNLRDGVCEITAGASDNEVRLQVFVDSDYPVVHVAGRSRAPVQVRATVENWRTTRHTVPRDGTSWSLHAGPFELFESADVFPNISGEAVAWYHRNEESTAFTSTIELQSLQPVVGKAHDPLLHRTFGGWLTGPGFKAVEGHAIVTAGPAKTFEFKVAAPCLQAPTANDWLEEARKAAESSGSAVRAGRRTAQWWRSFWDRSWVVTGAGRTSGAKPSLSVGEAYTLQRYMMACAGRGPIPIKFNGSIFTVEPKAMGLTNSPDWRRWGDCHWWQNVRFSYHTMLAGGDFEMMEPLFHMYEAARPLCEARAELYYGAKGCYFPETMTVWGTYANGDYAWERNGKKPGDIDCPWWQYAWNQGPELVALMLDRWEYTRDDIFLRERVLPMAQSVLLYFDSRFGRDSDGRLVLSPTQSAETFWYGVTNDMPAVAGLNAITARLGALPENLTTPEQRGVFEKLRRECPAVPLETAKVDGTEVRRLAPAQAYQNKRNNCENPELYAVWPFRLYELGKPGLEEAKAAYATRVNHLDIGWGYDSDCAALLGLTDEAARILKIKCANSNRAYRWPATWGPNFDWLPDQDHGANLLLTTQLMLLQSDGNTLRVLPAWPRDWDVSFKLHAPHNTTVECVYRGGKIERLKVTPAERRKDVRLF